MIGGSRVRHLSTCRSQRLSLVVVVCITALSIVDVAAGGCYATVIDQPAAAFRDTPRFVLDHAGEMSPKGMMPASLSPPTLSRLAVLSGPFQSFQESRVAKDPNCDRWGGRDKVRHAALLFATTIGLQLFFESTLNMSKTKAFLVSAAIGTLAGVSREFYDWKISDKDCFSEQDLLANTAGILAAGLVIMISN